MPKLKWKFLSLLSQFFLSFCLFSLSLFPFKSSPCIPNFLDEHPLTLYQVCLSQRRIKVFSRLRSPTLQTHLASVRWPERSHASTVKLHLPQIIGGITLCHTARRCVQRRLHKLDFAAATAAKTTVSKTKRSMLGACNCRTQRQLCSSIPWNPTRSTILHSTNIIG